MQIDDASIFCANCGTSVELNKIVYQTTPPLAQSQLSPVKIGMGFLLLVGGIISFIFGTIIINSDDAWDLHYGSIGIDSQGIMHSTKTLSDTGGTAIFLMIFGIIIAIIGIVLLVSKQNKNQNTH